MRVAVETLVSEKAFGVILRARVDDRGHAAHERKLRVRLANAVMLGRPVPGEIWDVTGEIKETRFGPQIEATRAVRAKANSRKTVPTCAANAAIPNSTYATT